jgi:probable F420-dependent oxidoreductase
MKYGFTLPGRGPLAKPDSLVTLAQRGEELGFHSLSAGDHILVARHISSPYPYTEGGEFPGGESGEFLEQLTLLSFIAGQTRRIRLVTSVIIVPHRNPLVAAKALATLDVLSGGRLVVGVGVGWMREEFEALGLPPFEERGAVTDEYIRAYKELWTSEDPSFEGRYCRFDDISFLPKPVQKPHPPIWVGGESRPALRRTAELGDAWYPVASNPTYPMETPEQLEGGMKRLASYARRFGRDPGEIEVVYRTHRYQLEKGSAPTRGSRRPFHGSAQTIASDIRRYEESGVSQFVVDFTRLSPTLDGVLGQMEEFATRVWPKV